MGVKGALPPAWGLNPHPPYLTEVKNAIIQDLFTHPLYFLRIILIVIISITLHELAHGVAALSQGDKTPVLLGRMTANPLVHMGWESIIFLCLFGIAWGQMPVDPRQFRHPKWGQILVSAAGPLLNIALGIICIGILKWNLKVAFGMILSSGFLYMGAAINLSLFLFNLLPIPPLDGFYVFSELFPKLKVLDVRPYGLLLLSVFMFTGFSKALSIIVNAVISTIVPSFYGFNPVLTLVG
jgi:Zn-dependent protease